MVAIFIVVQIYSFLAQAYCLIYTLKLCDVTHDLRWKPRHRLPHTHSLLPHDHDIYIT